MNIPDGLALEAKSRGIPVETYVERLLAGQIREGETVATKTPEQIRAWLDTLAQFSEKIPALPETITRDWIYREHD